METLYVQQENCSIRREGEHLKVTMDGKVISTVPLHNVNTLIIFDSVNLTAPALDLLLYRGINTIYLSKWGKIKGRVMSTKSGGAIVRLAQFSTFMDASKRLAIAKAIVSGKIHNQMSVIRKYQLDNTLHAHDGHLSAINGFMKKLNDAEQIDEILGIEGISAKYYWDCYRHLLKNPVFTRREYRPSPDYVNALLNLGYAFLCNEVTTCLLARNFDIEVGFLHSIHYGRNSLALDIMEEFRSPFIDTWVRTMLNKKQLKAEHFFMSDGDWRLTDDGFRKFCGLYHERVPKWRSRFDNQAAKLKTALLEGATYEPHKE
ncbi:MAG: CRISPR-associated endonuclease Cas1 [Defluviitaleaceae bacterium]|nr:CRISPR-associated endonuclease Cas1 [Defluviitaleaceae bacterium]